jgi:RNA polymerase sigma factor (sigma-70 family)
MKKNKRKIKPKRKIKLKVKTSKKSKHMKNKQKRKLRELDSFKPEDRKDIEAVMAVLAGKKEAYTRILERYRPYLVQRIFNKVKDLEISKDIAADILWKVYDKLDKYQTTYTFNAWFYMVADNYLVDWARKYDRADRRMDSYDRMSVNDDGDEMPVSDGIMKDRETQTDGSMLGDEKMAALREALSSLDEDARMLIDMFYNQNIRYEEMSKITGMPLGSLKATLYRAKQKLAEYFRRAYPEFELPAIGASELGTVKSEERIIDGETHTVYFA